MANPYFSILVAVRNAEKTLQRCIDSVAAQDFALNELIIVDGLSTDGTVALLKENSGKLAHWESSQDTGIYDALNKALKKAKGEWILILGADDYLWTAQTLGQAQKGLIRALPKHRIAYGKVAVVNEKQEVLHMAGRPWHKVKSMFFHEMSIPHQGVFHHKSLFEEFGFFDPSYRIAGDYELLLREIKNHDPLFMQDIIVTGMGFGGLSSLPESTLKAVVEFKKARRANGLKGFSFWLWKREVRARSRQLIKRVFGEKVSHIVADIYRVSTGKPRLWTKK